MNDHMKTDRSDRQVEVLTVQKRTFAIRIWSLMSALLWVLGVPLAVKPGIWLHYKGGLYVPLLSGRWSTNGDREGDIVIVYYSLEKKQICVRFETQFSEMVDQPPAKPGEVGVFGPRFTRLEELV